MATLITPARPITIRPSEAIIAIHPSSPVVQVRPATVIPIRPVLLVPITPARSETVRPPNRGAWDERGWIRTRNGNNEIYEGEYQVGGRRFRGRIEVARRGRIQAFIHNPPRAIRRHRHHACFQQVGLGTGWYLLHWSRSPRNVDEAILYFEQVLDESINM
ncbi:MAG: hypothetical protein IPM59_03530 [Chloracidobacterium sp.]|nr:hypothetical protein [Chloracidobacterium sp.]